MLAICILFSGTAMAQSFTGTFAGSIQGTPTTLTLEQEGTTLRGQADASGYLYTLTAAVSEPSQAQGRFTDPQTDGALDVELALQEDQLTLTLLVQDPQTGQVQRMPVLFRRGDAAAETPVPEAEDANIARDPRLVGLWSYTDTYVSGDFSGTSQVFMQVKPDGTYAYGNGRVMAGTSGAWGDTGHSGDVSTGSWRTQDVIIYVKENNTGPWVGYARYHIEGDRMLLTFGDGSKQLWHRQ